MKDYSLGLVGKFILKYEIFDVNGSKNIKIYYADGTYEYIGYSSSSEMFLLNEMKKQMEVVLDEKNFSREVTSENMKDYFKNAIESIFGGELGLLVSLAAFDKMDSQLGLFGYVMSFIVLASKSSKKHKVLLEDIEKSKYYLENKELFDSFFNKYVLEENLILDDISDGIPFVNPNSIDGLSLRQLERIKGELDFIKKCIIKDSDSNEKYSYVRSRKNSDNLDELDNINKNIKYII